MHPLVTIPDYWDLPASKRPTTFEEMCDLLIPRPGISGFWRIQGTDTRTGEVLSEIWTPNCITDNGAQASIGNLFAATANAYPLMNIACISTEAGSTTLSAALVAGTAITSLSVAALPNAIPANYQVKIDYANGTQEIATVTSVGAAAGATSIPINSFTPANAHAVGATVVPVALPTDNPSASPTGAQYLTMAAAAFGAISGSGQGNRTRTITQKFPGASTVAGTYTWFRICNANPIIAGSVGASCIVPQAIINSTTDQTFTAVIKL